MTYVQMKATVSTDFFVLIQDYLVLHVSRFTEESPATVYCNLWREELIALFFYFSFVEGEHKGNEHRLRFGNG